MKTEKVILKCFGCKVSQYEGFKLKTYLEKNINKKVYLIYGCAVTERAEQKVKKYIRSLKDKDVYVSGCISKIPFFYRNYKVLSPEKVEEPYFWSRTRYFLKIQDGCSNFCSYCIIPYLRRNTYSISVDSILKELEAYKESPEIVLCGINILTYSYKDMNLVNLIKKIKEHFSFRIRLSSLEPQFLDKETLFGLLELKNLVKHFHIPLQSGSNRILKFMRRNYTISNFYEIIELIRKKHPLAGITTDIIVGFPLEEEYDFEKTKKFVKKVRFSKIHIFTFSKRKGTVSYFYKDLPDRIKRKRRKELEVIEKELASNFAKSNIGNIVEVVTERKNREFYEGLSDNYLRVYFKGRGFKKEYVKVEGADGREVFGRSINGTG